MNKGWWYGVGLLVGLIILILGQMPDERIHLVVCDVGQGDAILLIKGSNQVLVDGGPSQEKILTCLEKYLPFYDRRIELIVLTNTDHDHLAGLIPVIERYEVIQFVTADGVRASSTLTKLREILIEQQIPVTGVERGQKLRVGRVGEESKIELEVVWPRETNREYVAVFSQQMEKNMREQILGASAKEGKVNERSVVLLLLEDNRKILLMGDAGDQTEKTLLELGGLPDIDILKVGHHGSKYASTLPFLERIKPELAIISVGKGNRYGHPTQETLERLERVGTEIARTDQEGIIEVNF
ncbi:MAG: internalization-related competence protein ComEC/Rec2 protein [Microgenomates group bacterium GW2011_GWD1_47_13]|uniref:Metallo-beta-lactamase domain-containing protein n=2 Tax=Candidatus Collieribacteriota TaxID=1752725 RepID=A0A1F5FZW9_9BACT|nr:MAG: internalization-related competence protein ComEC/Rec2 protein [Microgenomates group bacterium GW2011_GWF1_46_12]KKU28130.1 MAG: internalization-related competence protein ComEC/Rec2 protein [Microgenomates group bacterium GW2011_GWF2_46_18]KKU42805.1 MAG: internalization-related competence protein ComEC/Rec2 protein [Microgenomates group bacterium GW2011_GWA1_46_7]KKU62242.1 MAG: internalization-related competence protein ComEC/Rec2 protein [Microgenomates group bacterium GW2011_GWD1_47_